MKKANVLKSLFVIAMLIAVVFLTGCGIPQLDYDLLSSELANTKSDLEVKQFENNELSTKLSDANTKLADKTVAEGLVVTDLQNTVSELQAQLEVQAEVVAEAEAEVAEEVSTGYLLDELELNKEFEDWMTDKELSLFDGEVEFDGDDYEVEEVLFVEASVATNEEDFGANVYLTLKEKALKYTVTFEDSLNMSKVDSDETLKFNFLGQEVEVVEWTEDTVTFMKGVEYTLREGGSLVVDGKTVSLDFAADGYVYMTVEGDGAKIYEGETEMLSDLELEVSEVVESTSWRPGMVTFKLAEEVKTEAEDGEEYAKDSVWEWFVDGNTLGLVLAEEYLELDEDEEFRALGVDDKVCLPNDYMCAVFKGLTDEDMYKYSFEVDMKDGEQYLELKGDFTSDMKDFNKLYVNASGFYNKDLELVSNLSVEMDGTEFDLVLFVVEEEGVVVKAEVAVVREDYDELVLALNMSYMFANNNNLSNADEDYRTNYGLVLNNPEDSLEDGKLKFEVPEEQMFAVVEITN